MSQTIERYFKSPKTITFSEDHDPDGNLLGSCPVNCINGAAF